MVVVVVPAPAVERGKEVRKEGKGGFLLHRYENMPSSTYKEEEGRAWMEEDSAQQQYGNPFPVLHLLLIILCISAPRTVPGCEIPAAFFCGTL